MVSFLVYRRRVLSLGIGGRRAFDLAWIVIWMGKGMGIVGVLVVWGLHGIWVGLLVHRMDVLGMHLLWVLGMHRRHVWGHVWLMVHWLGHVWLVVHRLVHGLSHIGHVCHRIIRYVVLLRIVALRGGRGL